VLQTEVDVGLGREAVVEEIEVGPDVFAGAPIAPLTRLRAAQVGSKASK